MIPALATDSTQVVTMIDAAEADLSAAVRLMDRASVARDREPLNPSRQLEFERARCDLEDSLAVASEWECV